MYGSIKNYDSSYNNFPLYNNIISYDLSGNVDSGFNFNYFPVNFISQMITLSGTGVRNRLFAGFSGNVAGFDGNVATSYNGIIEINPTTGSIVLNTALQTLQTNSIINLLIPDASNNLFLIAHTSFGYYIKISGQNYNIAYYDISNNTITGIINSNSTPFNGNTNNAYYYSGYLYLQTTNTIRAYTVNTTTGIITSYGVVSGGNFQPSNNCVTSVDGKLYLLFLNSANKIIYQYTNYDLTSYNTQYTINSLSTVPLNTFSIYSFGSNLILTPDFGSATSPKIFTVNGSNNNILVNGYNPNTFVNGLIFVFSGTSNIYYVNNNGKMQYSSTNFANFMVTSPANIDKVYIKNTNGTPFKLYYTFNSLYYNGSAWEITATSNNYVN